METQATVSTANTGSLTPPGGSSSAEGRTAGEAIRAPAPLEPLTKASAECCSPQASLSFCVVGRVKYRAPMVGRGGGGRGLRA